MVVYVCSREKLVEVRLFLLLVFSVFLLIGDSANGGHKHSDIFLAVVVIFLLSECNYYDYTDTSII